MKVYKIELMVIDLDHIGEEEIKEEVEGVRYSNRCLYPSIMNIESADIGEWHDDHPLNKKDTAETEYKRLFKKE